VKLFHNTRERVPVGKPAYTPSANRPVSDTIHARRAENHGASAPIRGVTLSTTSLNCNTLQLNTVLALLQNLYERQTALILLFLLSIGPCADLRFVVRHCPLLPDLKRYPQKLWQLIHFDPRPSDCLQCGNELRRVLVCCVGRLPPRGRPSVQSFCPDGKPSLCASNNRTAQRGKRLPGIPTCLWP